MSNSFQDEQHGEQHGASELSGYPKGSLWLNLEYYHEDGRLKKQHEILLDKILKYQPIKNIIGNVLGYGTCVVTGNTLYHTELVSVPYSNRSGLLITKEVLFKLPKEKIARKVFEASKKHYIICPRLTLDEIMAQIPEGCMNVPRFER